MALYKPIYTQPKFVTIDLTPFDARYRNGVTGTPAYAPAMLLRIVLFAYSCGIISSRAIARACEELLTFISLSGD